MKTKIFIDSARWIEESWFASVRAETEYGTLSGSHVLALPEDATPEQIEAAIGELYK